MSNPRVVDRNLITETAAMHSRLLSNPDPARRLRSSNVGDPGFNNQSVLGLEECDARPKSRFMASDSTQSLNSFRALFDHSVLLNVRRGQADSIPNKAGHLFRIGTSGKNDVRFVTCAART
jgi:hypothetical protein